MSWLLLFASVVLIDQKTSIPAAQWRWTELSIPYFPAELECVYTVSSPGPGIRALLMTHRDAQIMRERGVFETLGSTPFTRTGGFTARIEQKDRYVLVFDNRSEPQSRAELAVRVIVRPLESAIEPRHVPAKTRAAVVTLSVMFLFGFAAYSLPRVWRAMHSAPADEDIEPLL